MKIIWLIFLVMISGIDLWKREIPVWIYGVFGVVGIVGILNVFQELSGGFWEMGYLGGLAGSACVGICLLLISWGSKGEIGDGDGWFFLISGLYLSWQENLSLLCYGLLLSSSYSMCLVIWGRWKGVSMRKKRIPFLPFILPVGIWVVCL